MGWWSLREKVTKQKNRESGLGTLGCCDDSFSGAHNILSLHHHALTRTQFQTGALTPLEGTPQPQKLCIKFWLVRVTMRKWHYKLLSSVSMATGSDVFCRDNIFFFPHCLGAPGRYREGGDERAGWSEVRERCNRGSSWMINRLVWDEEYVRTSRFLFHLD